MGASDDYLSGRRDAIDETLHLMGDYAMAGRGDRELRRELKRTRDEASRVLSGRLKRMGGEEGRKNDKGRMRGAALIIEQVLEEECWRSVDITKAMEERLPALSSTKGACDRPAVSRRARIERIIADLEATREIIVRGLGRTPRERPVPPLPSVERESD